MLTVAKKHKMDLETASNGILENNNSEDEIILQMSLSGVPLHSWPFLSELLEKKIVLCITEFRNQQITKQNINFNHDSGSNNDEFEKNKLEIINLLKNFDEAPFTLQRICELILRPNEHNRTLESLFRSFEILLSVSSTIPVSNLNEVQRLEQEYRRVISSSVGNYSSSPLQRSDTVEMDATD